MARLLVPPAGFVEPMLPTLVDEAPDGEAWVHEIKYDGYRTQIVTAGKNSRAYTRNGYDWTDKYGIVVAAAKALKCRSAVIDGEMCVQNAAGVTDFKALRSAIKRSPERLMLFAFDILSSRRSGFPQPSHCLIAGAGCRTSSVSTRSHACSSAPSRPAKAQRSLQLPTSTALRGSCRSVPTAATPAGGRRPGSR